MLIVAELIARSVPTACECVEKLLVLRLRCRAGVAEPSRVVAPRLAQGVGHVGVAHDGTSERGGDDPAAPALRQVPVVGDLVVVEDHVRRDVGEGPGDPGDGGGEDLDGLDLAEEAGALLGVALLRLAPLLRRVRLVGVVDVGELRLPVLEMVVGDLAATATNTSSDVVERTPQPRAPRQQVQGDELAVGQQVVDAVGGGEAADLADEVAAAHRRELDRVDGDVAVVDRQRLGEAEQLAPDGVDLAQQAVAEVVGVDLVAGEEQLLRAARRGRCGWP